MEVANGEIPGSKVLSKSLPDLIKFLSLDSKVYLYFDYFHKIISHGPVYCWPNTVSFLFVSARHMAYCLNAW